MKKLKWMLLLLTISLNAQAGVYKWTDENGKVHFSDKPHKNSQTVTIKTPKASGLGITKDQSDRQKRMLSEFEQKRSEQKIKTNNERQRKNKISNYCKRLRAKVLDYQEANYVIVRDENEKRHRISQQQKNQKLANLKKLYAKHCK